MDTAAMDSEHLLSLVPQLPRAQILIIKNMILNHYVYGTVEHISPETPIPVLTIEHELAMPDGTNNVARNLAALGTTMNFAAAINRDSADSELEQLLTDEHSIEPLLMVEPDQHTTMKTRFVGASQQLLRTDSENHVALSETERRNLMLKLDDVLEACDVLVLSDYGKDILEPDLMTELITHAHGTGKTYVVDPKGRDWEHYRGALVMTPNRHELTEASSLAARSDEKIEATTRTMTEHCNIGAMLATRKPKDMTLVPASNAPMHLPARTLEVFDVSGAGDTVVATLAAALAVDTALPKTMTLANTAADVIVGKLGTATCSHAELGQALRHVNDPNGHADKITDAARAAETIAAWRANSARIGFTNDCFDLLHPNHVALMRQARAQYDQLMVNLNTDASVHHLKGPTHPMNDEQTRATVLASLTDIDLVVPFDENTPLSLITALRPDVLMKNADYREDQMVDAEEMRNWGNKVVLAELTASFSTTTTIAHIGNDNQS